MMTGLLSKKVVVCLYWTISSDVVRRCLERDSMMKKTDLEVR